MPGPGVSSDPNAEVPSFLAERVQDLESRNAQLLDELRKAESERRFMAKAEVIKRREVSYKVVGGLAPQIPKVKEAVEYPMPRPGLSKRVGIEPPRGVLLGGPRGRGKPLLAKGSPTRPTRRSSA